MIVGSAGFLVKLGEPISATLGCRLATGKSHNSFQQTLKAGHIIASPRRVGEGGAIYRADSGVRPTFLESRLDSGGEGTEIGNALQFVVGKFDLEVLL
jgi:hypothetical protein